jgi:hypothetical protein
MKKTLIALAAVAVSGAAFAQVTMSGGIGFQYVNTKTAAGVSAAGFGSSDGYLNFAASEDLGGGLKFGARLGIDGIANGGADADDVPYTVKANTTSMSLSGGFGTVSMNTNKESCNSLAGVIYPRLDEVGFACANSPSDSVAYAAPAFGDVSLSVAFVDNAEGTITAGAGGKVKATALTAKWASGPAMVAVTNWSYSANLSAYSDKNVVMGSYDLGAAKVAVGYYSGYATAGNTAKYTVASVSAPLGAVTVSASYGRVDLTGTANDTNGTGVNVKYALSKRTSVAFDYTTAGGAGTAGTDVKTRSAVTMFHAF